MSVVRMCTGGVIVLLWLALLSTAAATVKAKHDARKLFVELRALEKERDELEIEWGQLQIEQSAWATHGRVENLARNDLNMVVPKSKDVAILRR